MSLNKLFLTALSLLIPFVLAGFVSQIGILVKPIAEQFNVTVTTAAAQFSWFLGGVLVGNLLSLVVLRHFRIKYVIVACYASVLLSALGIHTTTTFITLSFALTIIGVSCGVGVCAASTIVAAIWNDKKRGSVLVAQDALFNTGGIFFPFVTATLISSNLVWSWSYLIVGFTALITILVALPLKYDFEVQHESQDAGSTEWHPGLTVAGIGLFLVLIGKLTPILWLPTYLQDEFGVTQNVSAALISKIYLAGLIGSFVSAFVVLRMNIQVFISIAVIMGCASSALFAFATSMAWISIAAIGFGLAIAAIFHSFIAWGITYIKKPNYKHITFMYVCGGLGGTVAPYFSSKIADLSSVSMVFVVGSCLYGMVLLMMIGLRLYTVKNDAGAITSS